MFIYNLKSTEDGIFRTIYPFVWSATQWPDLTLGWIIYTYLFCLRGQQSGKYLHDSELNYHSREFIYIYCLC